MTPSPLSSEDLSRLHAAVRLRLGARAYALWFSRVGVGISGSTLTLYTPNFRDVHETIQKRYGQGILAGARSVQSRLDTLTLSSEAPSPAYFLPFFHRS